MRQAVICDVYGTLLEVGPPPSDAEDRWRRLWAQHVRDDDCPTLTGFQQAIAPRIAATHAAGRARGNLQPEVDWRSLATKAWPALRRIPGHLQDPFFLEHARLERSTWLATGAADCLRLVMARGWLLGIASNAQASTMHELAAALQAHSLRPNIFHPEICYFSYQHARAKPDPHVFSFLTGKLADLGVPPRHTLMVGDHPDNDIAPSIAAGWKTWLLQATPAHSAGPWAALHAAITDNQW